MRSFFRNATGTAYVLRDKLKGICKCFDLSAAATAIITILYLLALLGKGTMYAISIPGRVRRKLYKPMFIVLPTRPAVEHRYPLLRFADPRLIEASFPAPSLLKPLGLAAEEGIVVFHTIDCDLFSRVLLLAITWASRSSRSGVKRSVPLIESICLDRSCSVFRMNW
ncbi:hypothetical protein CN225_27745 [Sinorhizobium meliloti]|nr:hypothetical protein CN225_27745 [Sinorhizobium meliloti]